MWQHHSAAKRKHWIDVRALHIQTEDAGVWSGVMTIKIEALIGDTPRAFEYGNVFVREDAGGRPRLRVGLNEAQDTCVRSRAP